MFYCVVSFVLSAITNILLVSVCECHLFSSSFFFFFPNPTNLVKFTLW